MYNKNDAALALATMRLNDARRMADMTAGTRMGRGWTKRVRVLTRRVRSLTRKASR